MKLLLLDLVAWLACAFARISTASDSRTVPALKLPWGVYEAVQMEEDPNIYLFQNVRFGAKPQLFTAPSFPTWTNTSVQPSSDGRSCIQIDPSKLKHPPGGDGRLDDPADSNTESSEDCLFLDVYVPRAVFDEDGEANPLPVVVWIYGGAYSFGSKNQLGPLYTGRSILRESGYRTIFVAGNYRVGAYGWLAGDYMQKVARPNAGLYDQALLFEWVQEYVGQVKGDKSHVSAWGESAGAGSILHHLVRGGGEIDPHFETFAVQSPALEWAWDNSPGGKLDKVYQNFSYLAGCGHAFDIDCLRASKNLSAANQALFDTVRQTGLFPVGPAVDGDWVLTIPTISLANGNYWKNISSSIVSHCANETASFTPSGITSHEAFVGFLNLFLPGKKLQNERLAVEKQYACKTRFQGDYTACIAEVIRDASFTCNVRNLFDAFPKKTYAMKYSWPREDWARHASDLIALFSNSYEDAVEMLIKIGMPKPAAYLYARPLVKTNISSVYQTYFASFALSGDVNNLPRPSVSCGPAPDWPLANGSGDELTDVLVVRAADPDNPFALTSDDQDTQSTCDFWNKLAQAIVDQQGGKLDEVDEL